MIQLAKVDGRWHVITIMDGVRMCWLGRPDWDEPFDAEDTKVVESLPDDVCSACMTKILQSRTAGQAW